MHSHHHMLKYHIILPAIVLAVLVIAGVPLGSAASAAMGAGCIAMMVMMGAMAIGAALHMRPRPEVQQQALTD